MARKNKTASSRKKQAKNLVRSAKASRAVAKKSIRAVKAASKPSKSAAKQSKRGAKKFQRVVIRGRVKASTRKIKLSTTRRLKQRSGRRRVITTGPRFSVNIFAPIQNLTKSQATKIKRRISRAKERERKRRKKSDIIKQKEAGLTGLERAIAKRREWLIDIGDDPDLDADVKRSARRHIRAEIDRLIKNMERVERDLFKRYGTLKNATNDRVKKRKKPQGKTATGSRGKARRTARSKSK